MEPVFNPFEVLSLFAEVVVGQLGFQIVAVTVGRRGGGTNWRKGDNRLFFAMITCGALAISLYFVIITLLYVFIKIKNQNSLICIKLFLQPSQHPLHLATILLKEQENKEQVYLLY